MSNKCSLSVLRRGSVYCTTQWKGALVRTVVLLPLMSESIHFTKQIEEARCIQTYGYGTDDRLKARQPK